MIPVPTFTSEPVRLIFYIFLISVAAAIVALVGAGVLDKDLLWGLITLIPGVGAAEAARSKVTPVR